MLTLSIIDGILDFSKASALDLQKTPFSLRDCVEGALLLVAEPAATKDLELAYRNNCSNIEFIVGDITRFRQCVINCWDSPLSSKVLIELTSHGSDWECRQVYGGRIHRDHFAG